MRLEELIHPLPVDEFYSEYWERRSLVIPGDAERFAGLIGSRDLGALLRYSKPKPPGGIALVKEGQHCARNWTAADGTPRLEEVRAAWEDGYSLVLNDLGELWEPLARFSAGLVESLHHGVGVNLYYTPADSQAFAPHFDVTDVFILQLEGSKNWEVRGSAAHLPFPDEHVPLPPDRLPEIEQEIELAAGDVLYMPRGHVHSASTTGVASLHLTLSLQTVTWNDLFAAAIASARSDARFRRGLPPGFFAKAGGNNGSTEQAMAPLFQAMLADLPQHLSLENALARLAEDRLVSTPPPPTDDLLNGAVSLTADTVLTRRKGVICHVLDGPGYAGIQYSGGKIIGPGKIAAALRSIADRRSFTVRDLAGELNEREKLVLARRLVRDGLLVVEQDGGS